MSFAANPNRHKKPTVETEAASAAKQQKADRERIRSLLITLGDDDKKVLGQIRGLAGALEDDVELHGELMSETVLDCAKHLPLKTGIYAAFVARMLTKHGSWVASLLPRVVDELRAALRVGQAVIAQLLLRFLVGLSNCGAIALPAFLDLLQEVVALSEGLKPAKGGDLGVFLALATLPFLSPASYKMAKERVDRLVSTGGSILASRDPRWTSLLRFVRTDDIPDRLQALLGVLRSQAEAEWKSQAVLHVPGFEPSFEGSADVGALPALGVTAEEIRKSKVRLQVPLVASRLLLRGLPDDGADDQMSEHDRWILEDYILLTIDNFGRDVDSCAKQLLRIPVMHPQFEPIVIDTIFSQLLRLPSPQLLPLSYSRLLEELTAKQHSMKSLVEQAFQVLFKHASDLDEDTLETLGEAFAYHLMHNAYVTDWSVFTGDNVSVQAQRLLRRALERLQRLSFHQNLLHRLPEAVHVYVPPEPVPASSLPLQARPEFKKMLSFVKIKDASEEKVFHYCAHLRKRQTKKETEGDVAPTQAAAAIVGVTTLDGDEAEADASDEEAAAKRRKLNSGEAQEVAVEGVAAATGDAPAASDAPKDAAAAAPPGGEDGDQGGTSVAAEEPKEPKDKAPAAVKDMAPAAVKEEVKQEDEGTVKEPAAIEAANKEEGEFGAAPSEPLELETVIGLFMCAVLQNGAKTPTHMSKLLDGHQGVFSSLKPENEEDAHEFMKTIVRCIFGFWSCSSQRVEITIDAMLHRGLVNGRAVVEQALADRGHQGCDSVAVWNIINGVARKSLEQSQTVRVNLALAKKLGKTDELERRRRQLDTAIQDTAELFTLIFTGLVRNHQDFEETDVHLRHIMLQRILTIGRKYHAFVKPLIDAAESRVPGVAHSPEIAAIFQSLGAL